MSYALTDVAGRVLGCLVEKEVTVPATYPLTLKSVVAAANQTSGREPIMALSASEVEDALDSLREQGLIRKVHASHGTRVVKYRHVADEALELDEPAIALLAILLLRGPQTPGELRGRTQRLHEFGGPDDVLAVLVSLRDRSEPLVVELARHPGQKEQRWAHLLADPALASEFPPSASSATGTGAPVPRAEAGPEVALLATYIGHWEGEGEGSYPTIEPFRYHQQIDLMPIPGKPFLAYRSATRHATDGRRLHAESGFLRSVGADGRVELVVAQGSGLVEVTEGLVEGSELILASTLLGGSTTAKDVTATERHYQIDHDSLTYDIAMAAVGQPMTHHLHATLRRH